MSGTGGGAKAISVLSTAATDAPHEGGVYLFLDDAGQVLYVGKARDLKQRLRQHASVRRRRSRLDEKYDLVRRVVWEVVSSDGAALWREAELIFALRPPFNADPGLRSRDPVGTEPKIPYVVVDANATGALGFTLATSVPQSGRAYGCFPHLGKGVSSDLGIACSDGYTALLRLVWAASGEGTHMPAALTGSAPSAFAVATGPDVRGELHRFLSGTRAGLVDVLLDLASHRPDFMQPALRRDREEALGFYAAGPQLVRARRLRHGLRGRVLDADTYRRLVEDEIRPAICGQPGAHPC